MLERGHLYWAHLDKRRPVLVVSPNERNERASDVIVVPASTRLRIAPTHVALKLGEAGIPSASMLKCEQVTTLTLQDVEPTKLGAALRPDRMREVERALLRAIGVPVGY